MNIVSASTDGQFLSMIPALLGPDSRQVSA